MHNLKIPFGIVGFLTAGEIEDLKKSIQLASSIEFGMNVNWIIDQKL